MPCDSSHMEPTMYEIESYRILEFLYEVGLRHAKPDIYGSVSTIHTDTAELCGWCRTHDVTKQSLELQIWWRDHQIADRAREVREKQLKFEDEIRAEALNKLSEEEKKVLGL